MFVSILGTYICCKCKEYTSNVEIFSSLLNHLPIIDRLPNFFGSFGRYYENKCLLSSQLTSFWGSCIVVHGQIHLHLTVLGSTPDIITPWRTNSQISNLFLCLFLGSFDETNWRLPNDSTGCSPSQWNSSAAKKLAVGVDH